MKRGRRSGWILHLLFFQLFGDVFGTGSRDVDPGLGEEGARAEHEGDVEQGVDGIGQHRLQRLGGREIVAETSDRVGTLGSVVRPDAQQVDQNVSREFRREHLRDDVEVGDESRLKDDRDVRRVEQLDRVRRRLATVTGGFDRQINAKTLGGESEVVPFGSTSVLLGSR